MLRCLSWQLSLYGLDDRGSVPGRDFLFATSSRPALGPTQRPLQWVPRSLSSGVKRPRREADHSPPSSDEVKNAWRYTSTSIRLHGVEKLYLYLMNYISVAVALDLPLACTGLLSLFHSFILSFTHRHSYNTAVSDKDMYQYTVHNLLLIFKYTTTETNYFKWQ